jgi:Ca2+-binding EF-hand superfamily protein
MVVRSESEATLREWSKRVLKNLRDTSPSRAGENGEEKIGMNLDLLVDDSNPPLAFKDPHAARVFADMMPPKSSSARPRALTDQQTMSSKNRGESKKLLSKDGDLRSSKPRASKRSSLFEDPLDTKEEREVEDKEHVVAEAGHSKYILRTADLSMHVPLIEMIRCHGVLYQNPKGDLSDVLLSNARLADGMNEPAIDQGVETVPWLRVYRPDYFTFPTYPDLSDSFDKLLQQILSNVFTDVELECLYDMFMQYAIWRIDREVIDRNDMSASVYWVGIAPDPDIVQFCDEQVESWRLNAGKEQLYGTDGKVVYAVSEFYRWMAVYRLKFLESWNIRAQMPISVVNLVKEHFSNFDNGDGLKTREVFDVLGSLGKRPESLDDQKRVIVYIKKSDVDGSGTIDFFEFLMLLRMLLEDVSRIKASREQRLIRQTGYTPVQIDSLREAFDAFDPKDERMLSLAQMKKLFENCLGQKKGVTLDRNQMTSLSEIVKACTQKCRDAIASVNGEDSGMLTTSTRDENTVDLGEFCYVIKEANKKMAPEVQKVITEILDGGKSGLAQWWSKRKPCPDELRSRWEVALLERYHTQFYRDLLGANYTPAAHQKAFDTGKMQKWTASKVAPDRISSTGDAPTWDIVDGSAHIWNP